MKIQVFILWTANNFKFFCGKYNTCHYLLSDLHGTKITVIVIPKCCFRNVVKNIRNYCLKIGTVTWEKTLPKLMKTIYT